MEIKLIASDMDGTLLNNKKQLPEGFFDMVRALKKQGRTFVVASGRQYGALRRDMGEVAQDVTYIAENGALVMEGGRQLFIDALDAAEIPGILAAAKGLEGVYPCVCRAGCAVVESSASEEFIRSMVMYYPNTVVTDDLEAYSRGLQDICKVAFFDEGDAATHELPVLDSALSDHLAVILSGEQWVDVMKPGVHKGRAMQMLQEIKGVSPEQCMAFGDYLNDVQLLESVAESYAMENALPEIKKIARYIAPSNEECGVVRVIKERFSL